MNHFAKNRFEVASGCWELTIFPDNAKAANQCCNVQMTKNENSGRKNAEVERSIILRKYRLRGKLNFGREA